MVFSAITFKAGKPHEFLHNDRTHKTSHSIFTQDNNEYSINGEEALAVFNEDVKYYENLWVELKKKKMPSNTNRLMSVVVNLNETHTLEDVNKVADFLGKYLGVKIYQTALHRDEGYIDKNGEEHINHHAHILMSGIRYKNEIIESISNKIKKKELHYIQEKTAEILNMPRSYIKSKKRLDTDEYKVFAQKHSELISLNKKFKEENYILNKETKFYLKETLNKDEEIKQLKEYNEELKGRIKFLKQRIVDLEERYNRLYKRAVRLVKKMLEKIRLLRNKKKLKEKNRISK